MSISKEDFSYKKLQDRRVTSDKKEWYEEFPDHSHILYAHDTWADVIPNDPPTSNNSIITVYQSSTTLLTLKVDETVRYNKTWFAVTNSSASYDFSISDDPSNYRLKNFIPPKFGKKYEVRVYDNFNNEIPPTGEYEYIFDYKTGILIFKNNSPTNTPIKISGYRYTGNVGIYSTPGTQGATGATGSKGDKGDVGPQGTQGIAGTSASKGDKGDIGPQGFQGNVGPQGTQGIAGTSASKGDKGDVGFQGNIGATGPQGFQGNQGTQGVQGSQGFQGTTGATGSSGSKGQKGEQGIDGTNGQQGTQGVQGVQGSQGDIGTQGFQGLAGTQGNQGRQGSQGTQGVQGSQGFQGNQGNTGPQGFQGNQGTQGVQGSQGFQGNIGATGPQGFQGNQGTQGVQGSQGFQGNVGATGPQGFQGNQGTQGVQGSQGFQGNAGATGPQGFQGTQGVQGSQGSQGFQGNTGSKGDLGTSGLVFGIGYPVDNSEPCNTYYYDTKTGDVYKKQTGSNISNGGTDLTYGSYTFNGQRRATKFVRYRLTTLGTANNSNVLLFKNGFIPISVDSVGNGIFNFLKLDDVSVANITVQKLYSNNTVYSGATYTYNTSQISGFSTSHEVPINVTVDTDKIEVIVEAKDSFYVIKDASDKLPIYSSNSLINESFVTVNREGWKITEKDYRFNTTLSSDCLWVKVFNGNKCCDETPSELDLCEKFPNAELYTNYFDPYTGKTWIKVPAQNYSNVTKILEGDSVSEVYSSDSNYNNSNHIDFVKEIFGDYTKDDDGYNVRIRPGGYNEDILYPMNFNPYIMTPYSGRLPGDQHLGWHNFQLRHNMIIVGDEIYGYGRKTGKIYDSIWKYDIGSETFSTVFTLDEQYRNFSITSLSYDSTNSKIIGIMKMDSEVGGMMGHIVFGVSTTGTNFVPYFYAGSRVDSQDWVKELVKVVSDGTYLYVLGIYGGLYRNGGIAKVNISTTDFDIIYNFNSTTRVSDIIYANSKIYGIDTDGPRGYGSVFKVETDGSSFTTISDMSPLYGRPLNTMFYDNGNIYGASVGEDFNLFVLNESNSKIFSTYSTRYTPTGNNKAYPITGLCYESSGNVLYGVSGIEWNPTLENSVFKYNFSTKTYTRLVNFNNSNPAGYSPIGNPVLYSGNIYYTNTHGGLVANNGTLVRTSTSTVGDATVMKNFGSSTGSSNANIMIKLDKDYTIADINYDYNLKIKELYLADYVVSGSPNGLSGSWTNLDVYNQTALGNFQNCASTKLRWLKIESTNKSEVLLLDTITVRIKECNLGSNDCLWVEKKNLMKPEDFYDYGSDESDTVISDLVYSGVYDNSKTYYAGAIVSYKDNNYMCNSPVRNSSPEQNPEFWTLFSKKDSGVKTYPLLLGGNVSGGGDLGPSTTNGNITLEKDSNYQITLYTTKVDYNLRFNVNSDSTHNDVYLTVINRSVAPLDSIDITFSLNSDTAWTGVLKSTTPVGTDGFLKMDYYYLQYNKNVGGTDGRFILKDILNNLT